MYLSAEKFTFASSGAAADAFGVVRFTGHEGISQLYRFDITLISGPSELDLDAIMEKPAVFSLLRADQNVAFHGVLEHFDVLQSSGGFIFYQASLVPALWWLTLRRNNQVFLDKSVPEIIGEVLKEGGLSGSEYELRLQRSYPKREYVCQYDESNYNFLCRWLEYEGLYFFFEHSGSGSKMVITDTKISHHPAPQSSSVRYQPPSGLETASPEDVVSELTGRRNLVPKSVRVKDFNYRKPDLKAAGEAEVDAKGSGEVYIYGEHVRNESEGEALARVRAEEFKCREKVFYGKGTASFLRSGFTVALKEHFLGSFNQDYLITEARHEGSQAAWLTAGLAREFSEREREPHYQVHFTAIPARVQFRAQRLTPEPRFHGTINARIDADVSGEYAALDAQGRYKVILPFDLSGREGGKASSFVRMMQPYAGADHGMHFPLHKGAEVLLSFIDGDPDRPIIAGAAPNPENPSVVKDKNQTQAVIQTGGQNTLLFEDTKDNQRFLLKTPTMGTYLRAGSHDPQHEESEEEKGFRWHTEGKFVSEIGSDCSWNILGNKIEATVGSIEEVTAGAFTEITAGAFSEIVAGQLLDVVLGMIVEVKKGWNIEVGEAKRIGISPEEELIGAHGVSLRAGGEEINVKKAVAAAVSLVSGITSGYIAAAKTHKPSCLPRVAVAGAIGGISATLWAVIMAYLARTKAPGQFKSTLEMDKHKTELKSPKIELNATDSDVEIKAKKDVVIEAEKDLHCKAAKIAKIEGENIHVLPTEHAIIKGQETWLKPKKTVVITPEDASGTKIELCADSVLIRNRNSTGDITLTTDKFTWKPTAGGMFDAGKLRINHATGQVYIG